MSKILYLIIFYVLILVTNCARHRRQYNGYGYAQQYASRYQLYGPGGQGWLNTNMNNNPNNPFSNPQGLGWYNNYNWNQGNRRPEWYYNTGNTINISVFSIFLSIFLLLE